MGVIQQGGKSYQVEELHPQHQHQQEAPSGRHERAVQEDPVVVIYPLNPQLLSEPLPPPVMPDLDLDSDVELEWQSITTTPGLTEEVPNRSSEAVTVTEHVGGGRARRRTSHMSYTVELAVFVDKSLFSYIKRRYPGDNTNDKTLQIVMTLINAVHRLYSDESLGGVKIGMMVKKVQVLGSGQPTHAQGDIYKYLQNFCSWQAKENPRAALHRWDHALLLSGHDLWSNLPRKNSTVGLAYVGGMCSSRYSCILSEATSFAAAYIIAHEMGHNLNMKHDGERGAVQCTGRDFIMSSVMASGATTWSSCSRDALAAFLRKKGECLTPGRTRVPKKVVKNNHKGGLPGKRVDADEQCYYMYGQGWYHFSNSQPPFNDVCKEIWCRKGRILRTPSASALEGTPCGTSKVCKSGKCSKQKKPVNGKRMQESGMTPKGTLNKDKQMIRGKFLKKETKTNQDNNKKMEDQPHNTDSLDLAGTTHKKNSDIKKARNKSEKDKLDEKKKNKPKNNKRVVAPKRKTLSTKQGKSTRIKTKTKIINKKKKKKKKPKKLRRYETTSHIIIKERIKYVKGKGWKMKVIKIKKTKQMQRESQNRKNKNKIKCNKKKSKCKVKVNQRKSVRKITQGSKVANSVITVAGQPGSRSVANRARSKYSGEKCVPQKVKYIPNKGWLVKLPTNCL